MTKIEAHETRSLMATAALPARRQHVHLLVTRHDRVMCMPRIKVDDLALDKGR